MIHKGARSLYFLSRCLYLNENTDYGKVWHQTFQLYNENFLNSLKSILHSIFMVLQVPSENTFWKL